MRGGGFVNFWPSSLSPGFAVVFGAELQLLTQLEFGVFHLPQTQSGLQEAPRQGNRLRSGVNVSRRCPALWEWFLTLTPDVFHHFQLPL